MPSRRKRDSAPSYISKRRALVKALPGAKIPLPTSKSAKARISTLFLHAFGGKSRSGKRYFGLLKQPHSTNTFKTEKEAREVAKTLRVRRFGRTVITEPGRARLRSRDKAVEIKGRFTSRIIPRIRKAAIAEDARTEAARVTKRMRKNQRAVIFVGNRKVGGTFDRSTIAEGFEFFTDKSGIDAPWRIEIINLGRQRKGTLEQAIRRELIEMKKQRQKRSKRGRKKNRGGS